MRLAFIAMVVFGFFFTTTVRAVHSATSKDDVRRALDQKHEKVILGKEIDHGEYLRLLASFAGGPAGVAAYLAALAASVLRETGLAVGQETLFQLLKGERDHTVIGNKPVYAGIVTYSNWTTEKYPKVDRWQLSTGEVQIPRPNTHQFYVAIGRKGHDPKPQQLAGIYALRPWTGKYVSANNADPWQLHQEDELGPGEIFHLVPSEGGRVAIKAWTGRWVSANNAAPFQLHQVEEQGPAERFELLPLVDGSYAIRTWTSQYASANNVPPWQIHQVGHRMEGEAFHFIKLK